MGEKHSVGSSLFSLKISGGRHRHADKSIIQFAARLKTILLKPSAHLGTILLIIQVSSR